MYELTGCTGCGAEKTVTLDGHRGRRCIACLPPLPLDYNRGLAMDLVDAGRADLAFAHLRISLAALALPLAVA